MSHMKMIAAVIFALVVGGVTFQNCSPARYEAKSGGCKGDDCPTDPQRLEHSWKYDLEWSTCSVSCGGGTQVRDVWCENSRGQTVDEESCGLNRPATERGCNIHACEGSNYYWLPDAWSDCVNGTQTRSVACYDGTSGAVVAESNCTANKPQTDRNCTVTTYRTYVQDVPASNNQVDIFLVIDDSSSMHEDQKKLADRFGSFVQQLTNSGLDWRVCFTTTDTDHYHGAPLKWKDHPSHILKSTDTDINRKFRETIMAVGAEYSNDEQAIKAIRLAVEDNNNHKCFRQGAALSAIILSDEDERSVGGNSSLSKTQYQPLGPKNLPQNLVTHVKNQFGTQKRFNVNSIIVRDEACMALQDKQESPSFLGIQYATLSNLTGGYIGDICSNDYTENLRYFQDAIQFNLSKVSLDCNPNPNGLEVSVIPIVAGLSFQVQGKEISFSPILPSGSRLVVNYTCQ